MGLCTSNNNEDKAKSRAIDKQMREDQAKDEAINKLLFLGAGESGKSTLLKQMISEYGGGFNDAERAKYVEIVHGNLVMAIKRLVAAHGKLSQEGVVTTGLKETEIYEEVSKLSANAKVTPALGKSILQLWKDPAIQETFENRSKFQLFDGAKHFLDQAEKVSHPDYKPSDQDIYHTRVRTTGIVEKRFTIDGSQFHMFDVGGQRNERRKWIHCFDNVTAVLFVAAISAYDQVLFEDEKTNRLDEAKDLFAEIANQHYFDKASMILMLNKRDLFLEKIEHIPFKYGDYDGPEHDSQKVVDYIMQLFESQVKNEDKSVYIHVVCATDTQNVIHVFNAVKDTVIRRSLEAGGLLV